MEEPERDRVVAIATRLFAELGYDETSMRMIADAAGVDLPTLLTVAGNKPDLYVAVMRRAYQAEQAVLERAVADFTPSRQGMIQIADAYLDFYAGHPEFLALWMHRWMGDAADVSGLEDLYTRPLSTMVADAARDLTPPDVDIDYLIWTTVWCVFGFLSGGMQYSRPHRHPLPGRSQGVTPRALADFRSYLHTLINRLTAPCET